MSIWSRILGNNAFPMPYGTQYRLNLVLTIDKHSLQNLDAAYAEAKLGALDGSLRWGAAGIVVFGIAQFTWPLYRNLTVPFKTFLQMSTMITGGVVNADSRMQAAEKRIRAEQRYADHCSLWCSF